MSTSPAVGPDRDGLHVLLRYRQDGVVSRAQLLDLGFDENAVRRMLRRRDLVVVHSGVYVDHTGPLTPQQREWAAVLATGGVLSHESALPGGRRGTVVHVSVLERAYLRDLVRAHGLPEGELQAPGRVDGQPVLRDQRLAAHGLYVELDGRAFHDNPRARDRDLRRDLAAAVEDDSRTVRLGYGQVLGTPCATARSLAQLLRRLGWAGELTRCGRCPALGPT